MLQLSAPTGIYGTVRPEGFRTFSNSKTPHMSSSKRLEELAAAGPGVTADLSSVLEDHDSPLGVRVAEQIGRISTAVANATAMSLGIDVAEHGSRHGHGGHAEEPRAQVEPSSVASQRFAEHWNSPLCSELEFVLQKRVSKEECRHLAFFPDDRQIESYVLLFRIH